MNADGNNLALMFSGLCGLYVLAKHEDKKIAFASKILFWAVAMCFLIKAAHMICI